MQPLPHTVIWDDQDGVEQVVDVAEMMQRLARVLEAAYREKNVRDEPRYQLRRFYSSGFELSIIAGHIYDTKCSRWRSSCVGWGCPAR